MTKDLRGRILIILAVIAAAIYFTFPLEKRINLGLDLKGGMHLILKVDTEKLDANAKSDAVVRAIEILRNRIDGLGVAEPVIQRQGETEIIVQLPGITDREKAIQMIGQVALLEFNLVSEDPVLLKRALEGDVPAGHELKYSDRDQGQPILVSIPAVLKGEAIADAVVDIDDAGLGQPKISLTFNSKGAKTFGDITQDHIGDRLAIIMDGKVMSAPTIRSAILSGRGEITGVFTFEEASLLALALRSGSLPAPMHVEEERTIGPLLGKDSINAGVEAAIIGGACVLVFMIIYYLKSGIVSSIALSINLLLILGIMGLMNFLMPDSQITLTLPGIAGIILTLGMAVDANILINERMREEIENGRPILASITNGFSKAFNAIFDSNLTTLIAAFMLFQFGSGPIKGFSVTLTIGLLSSMFTALYVSKTLFLLLHEFNLIKTLPMMKMFPQRRIDFVSKSTFCMVLSAVVICVGLFAFFKKGQDAYGIDFVGGQIQEYKFSKPVVTEDIRLALDQSGIDDAVIQRFDQSPESIIIRTSADTYQQVIDTFKTKFPDNSFETMRIEKVGPVVGKALRKAALLAIIFAMAGILIYVGFRFNHFDFAAAGVIALIHDVLITLGVIILLGRQVDLLVVTALLTIAGYSINDTIVIYDRIRENLARGGKMSLADTINLSVNQTLGRTILTSSATLLVVFALFFKGGEILNTFALCLIIGFIAGVYSTVFIASPLVLAWQKKPKS